MLGKTAFTNKIVAKSLGIEESRVSRVMSFFIEELNLELVSCKHPFVYVKGLGTFSLSLAPIERKLRFMIKEIHEVNTGGRPSTRNPEKKVLSLRNSIFILFEMRRMLKNKRKENKEIRDARKVVDDNRGKLLPSDRKEQGAL